MNAWIMGSFDLLVRPDYLEKVSSWTKTSPAFIALRKATEKNRKEKDASLRVPQRT